MISHELMMKAPKDVRDGMSVRKAAKTHKMSRGTLRNNLKKLFANQAPCSNQTIDMREFFLMHKRQRWRPTY